jgi:predicted RND superfamily exporter protein
VARGILVAGLTTIIGFGALMISEHRGLAGLGAILALGVGGSLGTALSILPWILSRLGSEGGLPVFSPPLTLRQAGDTMAKTA